MIQFNREQLREKIYACWLGKNIGGTMGTPYEGKREINDIQGFVTKPREVLPNDDLDLQLVWLRAMDELGPNQVDAKALAEYWLSYIGPSWNEYGVGKANLREGLLPPLSGEMNNEEWKHSNGAWIRTEIWACTWPGCPEQAIRMAFEDACVDHGFGEGAYAAIFVAAMESAAFVFGDLRTLIDIGLSKIPADCRVARSVKLVLDAHAKGVDWKTARNLLVEDSADLGWFQAPANIGFVILGLLYGECDFKKSMILAINCGDDTDCTGATLGSLLGIMGGLKAIPEDWRAHLGDDIVTVSVIKGHGYFPRTCTELTDCVMSLIPAAVRTSLGELIQHGPRVVVTDGETDFGGVTPEAFCGSAFVDKMFSRSRFSYAVQGLYANVVVELDREAEIAPLGTLRGRVTVSLRNMPEQKHFHLRWWLPEGWHMAGRTNVHANAAHSTHTQHAGSAFTLTAGETVEAVNRVVLEVSCAGRALPIYVPMVILGA